MNHWLLSIGFSDAIGVTSLLLTIDFSDATGVTSLLLIIGIRIKIKKTI